MPDTSRQFYCIFKNIDHCFVGFYKVFSEIKTSVQPLRVQRKMPQRSKLSFHRFSFWGLGWLYFSAFTFLQIKPISSVFFAQKVVSRLESQSHVELHHVMPPATAASFGLFVRWGLHNGLLDCWWHGLVSLVLQTWLGVKSCVKNFLHSLDTGWPWP